MGARYEQAVSDASVVDTTVALELVGAPFVHQGRAGRRGVDCVGVATYVAERNGIRYHDSAVYERDPDPETFTRILALTCERCAEEDAHLLRFWVANPDRPQHIAARLPDGGIVHAFALRAGGGRVVHESPMPRRWRRRLVDCWRYVWPR